jgi:hypothetical protein
MKGTSPLLIRLLGLQMSSARGRTGERDGAHTTVLEPDTTALAAVVVVAVVAWNEVRQF